jgi:hypothetical protein
MNHELTNCSRLAWVIYLVLAGLTMSGCGKPGPKAWPMTGTVTFQGRPVSAASIRFRNPQSGIDLVARLDAEEKYAVETAAGPGLPEGTYQVAILPGGKSSPVGTFGVAPIPNRPDIPEKYRSTATSGLSVTVKSDDAVFNVDM